MSKPADGTAEARRVKQAIGWLVRLHHDDNPGLRRQCEAWRREDASHERAWQRVSGMQAELAQDLRALPAGTLDTLESSALRLRRRQALKLLSLAALAGGSAWLARDTSLMQPLLADQATAVGEQRRVALGNGDALELNTASAVDVQLSGQHRRVLLRQGEIFVTCQADARPPLQVRTADGLFEVQALGEPTTRFGLRLEHGATRLSVEQGSVGVAGQPGFQALAGQHYRIAGAQAVVAQDDGMDPSAWRDGLIVTRDMRLDRFLAEVARYRHGHLGCTGEVATLRLSGVFRLADTDELLRLLSQTLPVRVRRLTPWWVQLDAA